MLAADPGRPSPPFELIDEDCWRIEAEGSMLNDWRRLMGIGMGIRDGGCSNGLVVDFSPIGAGAINRLMPEGHAIWMDVQGQIGAFRYYRMGRLSVFQVFTQTTRRECGTHDILE